jgi:hypothetical protein
MTEQRFIDNGDGTVSDSNTGLLWIREDVWQLQERWVTWDEARDFTNALANNEFCGLANWRLPTIDEARSLYDPAKSIKDKYGQEIHIDPVFTEGGLATIWLGESISGNDGYIMDLRTGEVRTLYKSKCPRMTARAVCTGTSGAMSKPWKV